MKPICLNLGCGRDHKPGWINLDIDHRVRPQLVADVTYALPFTSRIVDRILVQDVLEHLTIQQGERFLKEIHRVSRIGANIELRIPQVKRIIKAYRRYPDLVHHFIYGNTEYSGVWGAHKAGYDRLALSLLALRLGFRIQSFSYQGTNLVFRLIAAAPELTIESSTRNPHSLQVVRNYFGQNAVGEVVLLPVSLTGTIRMKLTRRSLMVVGECSRSKLTLLERMVFRWILPEWPLIVASPQAVRLLIRCGYSHLRILSLAT